jgi:hypothetical protein
MDAKLASIVRWRTGAAYRVPGAFVIVSSVKPR